ncbi:hypothetical protein Tco_1383382 [Tanacetum coccineum]
MSCEENIVSSSRIYQSFLYTGVTRKLLESSSRKFGVLHICNTFNQPHVFVQYDGQRITRVTQFVEIHPNSSNRRHCTDPGKCVCALTEEIHRLTDYKVWELVDKLLRQDRNQAKVVWKNKKDGRPNCNSQQRRLVAKGYARKRLYVIVQDIKQDRLEKNLKEVKRFISILKRFPFTWDSGNPKDSGFELTAFSDAGCLDTRKSTSGGIQFLSDMLVSWIVKSRLITAMSLADDVYVGVICSCAQVMLVAGHCFQDYGFKYTKYRCTAILSQP